MSRIIQGNVIENNFFFIDSTNIDSIESRLYGFVLQNGTLYSSNINPYVPCGGVNVNALGTFCKIEKKNEELCIQQDFTGSYGLYFFYKNGYFAISNSFWHMVEGVKYKFPLTLNYDYANVFLRSGLTTYSVSETLIKEIQMLPRNVKVRIDLKHREIWFEKISYAENSLPIDTPEGIRKLDEWATRWTGILQSLKAANADITVELSGGMDSRMTMALVLLSGIDMNGVLVSSANDDLHTHSEDYKIASQIAEDCNFKLNERHNNVQCKQFSMEEALDVSFYTKLGMHKELPWKMQYYLKPRFIFGGHGGGILRGYDSVPNEADFVAKELASFKDYNSSQLNASIVRLITNSFNIMHKMYDSSEWRRFDPGVRLYIESRNRYNFGKNFVEHFIQNTLIFAPLLDPLIRQMDTHTSEGYNPNVLFALIQMRYANNLTKFPFDSNRHFSKETLMQAESINGRWPYRGKVCNIERINIADSEYPHKTTGEIFAYKRADLEAKLLRMAQSREARSLFESRFPGGILSEALRYAETGKFFPLRHVSACVAAIKIIRDISFLESKNYESNYMLISKFINKDEEYAKMLLSYRSDRLTAALKLFFSARLDIKCFAEGGDVINLLTKNKNISITCPGWIDEGAGKGYVLQSDNGSFDIIVECFQNGELELWLRGIDKKDNKGNRMPLWVDFLSLRIEGEEVLKEVKAVCHDVPYKYRLRIDKGAKYKLKATWQPHGYSTEDMLSLLRYLLEEKAY